MSIASRSNSIPAYWTVSPGHANTRSLRVAAGPGIYYRRIAGNLRPPPAGRDRAAAIEAMYRLMAPCRLTQQRIGSSARPCWSTPLEDQRIY